MNLTLAKNFKGLLAEYLTIFWYLCRFYTPVKHRYRNYCGEIDFICSKRGLLVFVEVKYNKMGLSEYTVSPKQRQRISNAADCFLMQNAMYQNFNIRFDLSVITPYTAKPQIITNAW
jgi:putative endonuclease